MIETSQTLIDYMRNIQVVSTRINILNSPEIHSYSYETSDKDKLTSNLEQLQRGVTHETANYAIFEGEGIKLDGSQRVVSKNNKTNQYGWYSENLSDANGNIESWLDWYYYYSEKNINLNIVFSKEKEEYAVDFDIVFYNYTDDIFNPEPIETVVNVRNNTDITYSVKAPDCLEQGCEVLIKILKWSKPNSKAKIVSLYFGEMLEYTDENIVDVKTIKEVDLLNESTPSKEMNLTLQDIDGEYNIFEPKGELANLNVNSRIIIEQGCVIDDFIYYVKTDEYISKEPVKEQNSIELSITGIGRLSSLYDTTFEANSYEKFTAEDILEGGTERNIYYKVDDQIKNEVLTIRTQYSKDIKTPEALSKIAIATRSNIIETIDNNILLKRIEETEPVATINLENMLTVPKISKVEIPKEVEIKTYTPKVTQKNQEIFRADEFRMYEKLYFFNYNVEHSAPPYTATIFIKDFPVLDSKGNYLRDEDVYRDVTSSTSFLDGRAIFMGYMDNADWYDDCSFYIKGNVVEIVESIIKYNVNDKSSNIKNVDNESIDTEKLANIIFEWININLKKEFEYTVEVQDTFTYELGDTVLIETGIYVNDEMIIRKAIITKIEQEYNGALHYFLTLRGA